MWCGETMIQLIEEMSDMMGTRSTTPAVASENTVAGATRGAVEAGLDLGDEIDFIGISITHVEL